MTLSCADEARAAALSALKDVYDPEIPVNIVELGLIYTVTPTLGSGQTWDVRVDMTLTTANCPMADLIPGRVKARLAEIPEFGEIDVRLVWDPPWDPGRMSEQARLALDMMM